MTRSLTSAKVLLVADRRAGPTEPGSPQVRRYRLARLRLDGRAPEPYARYEHLKRVYD